MARSLSFMARSLSQPKPVVSHISHVLFSPLQRRGFADVSGSHVPPSSGGDSRMGKLEDKSAVAIKHGSTMASSTWSSAWIPDPVTGYYRPGNYSPEIDPAELRLTLLNHRSS